MSDNGRTNAATGSAGTVGTAGATGSGKRVRILLVDDHHLVIEGLRAVLSTDPDLDVVGEARTGREAIGAVELLKPDVVLMDIRMPDMDGIAATRHVKQAAPQTSVIMLTMYENPDYLFDAVKAGASGYVLKDVAGPDLLEAIHTVVEGGSLLNQEVVGKFLRQLAADAQTQPAQPLAAGVGPERLTPRELEVLQLIAGGLSNKEIGARLSVSVATVKTHLEHILQKLQVSDRTQAAVQAVTRGLLPR
ncbi:MAG TPA: response regulator transcription factor [Chloroflexota bacterium]|nr:response regulator transcription factor [Chloroflexota bacterium]